MKMFGFKLADKVQMLTVECPSCHSKSARLLFRPIEKDMPIPLYGIKDVENLVADVTTMPQAEDSHFLCMACIKQVKLCEVLKRKCSIDILVLP